MAGVAGLVAEVARRVAADFPTSASLLDRLRDAPGDQAAWAAFVDRYAPVLYDWCRRWGLQDADAQDVTQAVLVKLVGRLRTFRYDPAQSFRKWLWTVAHHAWLDFRADRARAAKLGGPAAHPSAGDPLDQVASRDDLLARLDAEFDCELLDEASARVRLRVESSSWQAYQLTAVDGLPAADAAARLGLSVAAVFKAKARVLKSLTEEVRRLDRQ